MNSISLSSEKSVIFYLEFIFVRRCPEPSGNLQKVGGKSTGASGRPAATTATQAVFGLQENSPHLGTLPSEFSQRFCWKQSILQAWTFPHEAASSRV